MEKLTGYADSIIGTSIIFRLALFSGTEQIVTKIHMWPPGTGGLKVFANSPGRMSAMCVYAKKHLKSCPEPKLMALKFGR